MAQVIIDNIHNLDAESLEVALTEQEIPHGKGTTPTGTTVYAFPNGPTELLLTEHLANTYGGPEVVLDIKASKEDSS